VHGAWHGGWCWRKLTPRLREAGHDVLTPTLTGLGERRHLLRREVNLTTHIQDVANVLEYEDARDVVLVGHSYAGQSFADMIGAERRAAYERRVRADGEGWLLTSRRPVPWAEAVRVDYLVGDEDAEWMSPRLGPQPWATLTSWPSAATPRRSTPPGPKPASGSSSTRGTSSNGRRSAARRM